MRNYAAFLAVSLVALSGCLGDSIARRQSNPPALAHNVYFTLHDSSEAARAGLVADCYRYLRNHPGVTFFAAGAIVEEHAREVNVRGWDVGLHMVFASKDYHDRYQTAPGHQKFIDANRQNWKAVQVYDTYIE
jgi:hypothetical protein